MYLSRLTLNHSRLASLWLSNPYRIHQRLKMACDGDPRLLFRLEETEEATNILVQSHVTPQWATAFADLPVLLRPPETKLYDLRLQAGLCYRFRLLANPTMKKTVDNDNTGKHKIRIGLTREADQRAWLKRKLETAGAELLECLIIPSGKQHSRKGDQKNQIEQTHLAVLFEGILLAKDTRLLENTLANGIGSAKGFGFGLLSLAPVRR